MTAAQAYFNGINGLTGQSYWPPQRLSHLASVALGEVIDRAHLQQLKARQTAVQPSLGVPSDVDPGKLDQAGWGVLFSAKEDPQVIEALAPLLNLRREQAGKRRYYQYSGEKGLRPGATKSSFLREVGFPGLHAQVDPDRVPYYLLIVGSPEKIPFRLQHQLDVEFAVGRIHFDTLEEYRRYAESVVNAERGQVKRPRAARFFGVANPGDPNTAASMERLVKPLAAAFSQSDSRRREGPAWDIQTILADAATKRRLGRLLGGDETPALLFTASHGMIYPKGNPRQRDHNGALVCQEYIWQQPIDPTQYFAAADVASDADVHGMIAFFFACWSGGTPRLSELSFQSADETVADEAFLARLPARLLAHPTGGALAVVGHVDTALGHSFLWPGSSHEEIIEYRSALDELMHGMPIGYAMEGFGNRYANITSELEAIREDVATGGAADEALLAELWSAKIDARSFVVLGDPAVRLFTPVSSAIAQDTAGMHDETPATVRLPADQEAQRNFLSQRQPAEPDSPVLPIHRRWALLVGINRYADSHFSTLQYCVNDVLALEQRLRAIGYTVCSLHDAATEAGRLPTRANIEAALSNLCQSVGRDDLLLVYFACHGALENKEPVLITWDTDADSLATTALPVKVVERTLRQGPAGRQVLLLDACHAGVALHFGLDPTFLHNVYELAQGFALIAASTAQQEAREWQQQQHGLFTYFLLEALAGAADRTGKGFITVDDIRDHILDGLRRWTAENQCAPQEPTARTEGIGAMIVAKF